MGKSKSGSCSAGFTLIELIVVISVLLLFIGFSIATYNTFAEEKKLEQEAKRLASALQSARTKAASGDVSPTQQNCPILKGYRVAVSINPATYTLERNCLTGSSETFETIQQSTFPTNITVVSPVDIFFKTPSSVAMVSSASPITIKNTTLNKCIDITVSSQGAIRQGNKYAC